MSVDATHKFISVEVVSYGKQRDGENFSNSSVYQTIHSGTPNIPPPKYKYVVPHIFIEDTANPLKKKMHGVAGHTVGMKFFTLLSIM